jgi:hypothetical protein
MRTENLEIMFIVYCFSGIERNNYKLQMHQAKLLELLMLKADESHEIIDSVQLQVH